MRKVETKLDGVLIIESEIFNDSRGFFTELYNFANLRKIGIDFPILQVNHSFNIESGTLRGLHFQLNPFSQSKIVTCPKGAIFDVAVDMRPTSKNFLKYIIFLVMDSTLTKVNFSEDILSNCDYVIKYPNKILIPKCFAHGYLTLFPSTEVLYFTDNIYSKEHDFVVRYNDPKISIPWPKLKNDFIISEKDANAPFIDNFDFSLL